MLLLSFLIGLIAAGESALQPCHRPLELVRARYHGDRRAPSDRDREAGARPGQRPGDWDDQQPELRHTHHHRGVRQRALRRQCALHHAPDAQHPIVRVTAER